MIYGRSPFLFEYSKEMFRFSIDRGGTFTDVYAECPGGEIKVMKLLSEDPANYPDAPREAIRRIMQEELGVAIPSDQLLDSSRIEWIRMGTTVATNALLERKGEKMALVITKGFRDLLHIGNQSRPSIFDLRIEVPEVLYEDVVEVEERVILAQESCQLNLTTSTVIGTTGEKLHVWTKLNEDRLKHDLQKVLDNGIKSLSVVLMHSYTYTKHEEIIESIAREMGFTHVSLSSAVMPMVRIVQRGYTACADGYLTPCIFRYVQGFASGFKNPEKLRVLFMQSDGGLTPMDKFNGSHAILSGPAGGVVGYAVTTYHKDEEVEGGGRVPVIGFDMGGTSTDVSRYDGEYEHVFESTIAGVTIQAPQLDINTVAAGGGSMLFFRSGMFVVGPESAGANPGPTCYGKGGPLTVTDANLCLGRLLPQYFPKIFGPNEDESLNHTAMMESFKQLTQQVNTFLSEQEVDDGSSTHHDMTAHEVAMGFVRVANEAMCRPIRALTQGKGYDTSKHKLACFGGAGGQHACAIARSLGMSTVFVHRYSGILSAYGLALADVVHEAQEPCALVYKGESFRDIDSRINVLTEQCVSELESQGFKRDDIETTPFLHLRYERTDCALMCTPEPRMGGEGTGLSNDCQHGDFEGAFTLRYQREFGFTIPSRPILVDDIRVRGTARACSHKPTALPPAKDPPRKETVTPCYFGDGVQDTSVFLLEQLCYGHQIQGPAIIIDKNSTILVEPACVATITMYGDVEIQVGGANVHRVGTELDTIQLSIFSHRFMSTAEQMGRVLQRTSISTNIKERLDFSCALFGPDGGLVANAPHIPVHLGAMQEAVQWQLRYLHGDIQEGDVILSNHPAAGGSHLPDLTVITPVFYSGCKEPVFFVASRGHHADIGGITPGSMPPYSKYLWEEGMNVKSFKLVRDGVFQEEGVTELLMAPGKHPGSSGTRNLHDNLSDLRAQVAANQKGILLVKELIDAYGLDVVQAYMGHIQENAELAVRDMLKTIAARTLAETGQTVLIAEDYMDDGTPIRLKIEMSDQGSALFDFEGTGPQVDANTNAPRAVVLSALIYCLRCMVGHDVPLNQGCLKPVQVVIPKNSILDPSDTSAVVGGNVLTCQRIVDVVFKAFGTCAASLGCMNNTTFGDDDVGYYETVAGGAGAGPGWHGRSGVHCHMTNTRITDPEILERRYPAVLLCFHLNKGTGGDGKYQGGDGVIREMMFRKTLTLCILTERRVYRPFGLKGGSDGSKGRNTLVNADKTETDLGAKNSLKVNPGDTLRLETPGGGGYGSPSDHSEEPRAKKPRVTKFSPSGSVATYQMTQESA